MEGITLLTKDFRTKRTDDSSGDSSDDLIDPSHHHSLTSLNSDESGLSEKSAHSMVSFLSMGEDPLDDLDSASGTSLFEESDEDGDDEDDHSARFSDASLSSKSGDSIVESGESDPEDSSDDSSHGGEDSTKHQGTLQQDSPKTQRSLYNFKSPAKSPSKRRGVLPIASSDSLLGGVRDFFRRSKPRKERVPPDTGKEIPATRTRRGGKRSEQETSGGNSQGERGVIRTSTSDSLTGAARPPRPPDPSRSVQRTSTSDSLTGVDTKKHTKTLHGARTRRGGKKNKSGPDENADATENVHHAENIDSEPTRGVMRTSTTDSLGGVDTNKNTHPLHSAKTRRGGKRTDMKTENEEPSETADGSESLETANKAAQEPRRGVTRTSTSDSLGGVETINKKIGGIHARGTRRGGKRYKGNENEESSEGLDGIESTDSPENATHEQNRGVQRTSTSDSLTGVDTRNHTNPLHGAKTRRGGRRKRGDADDSENADDSASGEKSENSNHSASAEPSRGVARTSTSDSLTGVDAKRSTYTRRGSKTRRGGRRNRKDREEGDDSEGLDTSEYAADTSDNATHCAHVEPSRGVVRTSTSDSLTGVDPKRNTFARQGSKSRRGGRRNGNNVNGVEGDHSEGLDSSEYAANPCEDAEMEVKLPTRIHDSTKTRRGGRRNKSQEEETVDARDEQTPRTNTVDSLLGTFGLERKRGVQRTSTSDSLTGLDSKKNSKSTRRVGTPTPTTSDESLEDMVSPDSHQRAKTTMDKVLGAFGLQRGVHRTSTSDSLTGVDTKTVRSKEIHRSRTRRGGRRNRGDGDDESESSENPSAELSPGGKGMMTNTSDTWSKRLIQRSPLSRTVTSDSLEGADPNKHNNHPIGTKTRRGRRRPQIEEGQEIDEEEDDDDDAIDCIKAESDKLVADGVSHDHFLMLYRDQAKR